MGSLYRPKYRGTDGTLKESAIIWLKYRDALGVLRREASGTEKEQEARRLLKQREGASVEGRVLVPRADRVTIAELAENLRADYKANGRKSADRLEFSLAHLLPVFGARKAITLTSADVTAYRVQRQEAGAAAATINRELAGFTKSWRAACLAAGLPGRIPHDFRRTAVRNLERAGVPRSTAMKMVGHETESVYRRYAIVDEVMLQEGGAKLAAYSEGKVGTVSGVLGKV